MKNKISASILSLLAICATSCGGSTSNNYYVMDQSKATLTYNKARTAYVYDCEANQAGDVRVLVVPVEFVTEEDDTYSADNLPLGREGSREAIKEVMFGEDNTHKGSRNQWESLASFYNESSYGKCNITGYVADWWTVNRTVKQQYALGSVSDIINSVNDYYVYGGGKKILNQLDEDLDANDDGFIDATLFVYTPPMRVNGNSDKVFWAYVTQRGSSGGDVTNPNISRYMWGSFWFMFENGYYAENASGNLVYHEWTTEQEKNNEAKFDVHTWCHEFGHVLGLPDYYDTAYTGSKPLGAVDMMDYNVGDHNAVSKALYNWISPYVVTGNSKITLRSFQLTGDAILLPIREANWTENSYSLCDEYFMVEFDTPEGLYYNDATYPYLGGEYPTVYSEPGVKFLHADVRLGVFQSGTFLSYTKNIKLADESRYVFLAHSNTTTESPNNNAFLELILPNGKANSKSIATNSSLFHEGDELKDYKMNTRLPDDSFGNTYQLGWDVKVDRIYQDENGAYNADIVIKEI